MVRFFPDLTYTAISHVSIQLEPVPCAHRDNQAVSCQRIIPKFLIPAIISQLIKSEHWQIAHLISTLSISIRT